MENKILDFAEKNFNKLKLGDQDLINIFFQNEIEYLDSRWNNIVWHWTLLSENKNSIFHTVWNKKADHIMFPNYKLKKMYFLLAKKEKSLIRNMKNILYYISLWKPVWYWELLWDKNKSDIKINIREYISLLILTLHPLILFKIFKKVLRKINVPKIFP